MPNAPITSRTLLWERLSDGSIHLSDWCLVVTSLGVMVEPRLMTRQTGDIKNEDLFDSAYSDLQAMPTLPTGNYGLDQLAFAGSQWPHYRATDPGVD